MDEEIWEAYFRQVVRLAAGELDNDSALLVAWISGQFLPDIEPSKPEEKINTPADLVKKRGRPKKEAA